MPYIINKTNGAKVATVQDGTIDPASLDLTLVGKNYTGYGEIFNENFVKLLENFSSTVAPAKKITGQIWFDATNKKLKVYDSGKWKSVGVLESQENKPAGYNSGDLWWNKSEGRLYAYTGVGTNWTLVGPTTTRSSVSGAIEATVLRATTGSDTVLKLLTSGVETSILSAVDVDVNAGDDSYDLYPELKRGLTLPSEYVTPYGISYKPATGGYIMWGTAATALGLVNTVGDYVAADQLLLRTELASYSGSLNISNDNGIIVGSGGVVRLHSTATNIGNISVEGGTLLRIGAKKPAAAVVSNIVNFDARSGLRILPNPDEDTWIGGAGVGEKFAWGNINTLTSTVIIGSSIRGTNVLDNGNRVLTSVTFNVGVGISGGGTISGAGGATAGTVAFTNTGILSVTGTANQVNITAGQNPTFSLPQSIHTSANPTFNNLILTNTLGVNTITVATISGTTINGTTINDNGSRVLTVATINSNAVRNVYGTANQVSVSSAQGDVTFSTPQNIHTGASPTFNGLTLSSLSADGDGSQVNGTWSLNPGATWQATFADLAERYHADAEYSAGTVLVIGGTNEVTATTERASLARAGIVSTASSFKMNYAAGTDETHPYIALAGRVPCKAIGPIAKGDLLVTSATAGHAEKALSTDSPLAIIGRALGDLAAGTGVVEVMVI
jgi:hypothetical protein